MNKSFINNGITTNDNYACKGFENLVTINMNTTNTGLKCMNCDNRYNH